MNELLPNTEPDASLVARVLGGAQEAFSLLLARHYAGVIRLCVRLLGPNSEAEDIAQEAALVAFLDLQRLSDPARFGAWFHAIAANLARMALRRQRQMLSLEAMIDWHPQVVLWPLPAPLPEEMQMARELHDAIIAALSELSPANRDVAIGFFLEGYSYTELAEILGVPLSTIKGRLFKSRRRLQRTLAPYADTPQRRNVVRKEQTMSADDLIPVTIIEIRVSAWSSQRVVVLSAGDGRALPIWIGTSEGDSIAHALRGEAPARPMTHDLALQLLTPLGTQLTRVVISKVLNHTFYAEITLTAPNQTHTIDARPSDALALAVRAGAPIFVDHALFEACFVTDEQSDAGGFTLQRESAPPSFGPPTLHYLSQLATAAGQSLDEPESIQWDAQAVEVGGVTYTSIRLPGEQERRLLMEGDMWTILQNKVAEFAEGRRKMLWLLAARSGDTIEPNV